MRLAFILFLLSFSTAFSQEEIRGKVYSGAYLKPVSDISVRCGIRSTKTNFNGEFTIPPTADEPLQFSSPKFHTQEIPLERFKDQESVEVYLTPSSFAYSEVISSNPVETVRAVDFENIFDYTFLSDTLVILSYMKSKQSGASRDAYLNCALTVLKYGEIIDRQILPDRIKSLHLDPYNQLILEGLDFCHIVIRDGEKIRVESFDLNDFYDRIQPIYAIDSNKVY